MDFRSARILLNLTIKSYLSNDFFKTSQKSRLHLVAAVAILLYGEGLFTVYVTGAARLSCLHLRHCDSLVFRRGEVELDMAISALIQAHVKFVAEFDVPRILQLELDLLYGMTLCAIIRLKGVFAIVTGAAGPSFIHQGHGDRLFYSQIENLGVTGVAFTGAEMFFVTECHRTRFFDFDVDV
jgi:hypothetical protein